VNRRDFLSGSAAVAAMSMLPAALRAQRGPAFHFTDVTAQAGLRFRHNSGAYGGKLLP